MSDQFAVGLLHELLVKLEQRVEALEMRVEELEMGTEEAPERYMDGTPIR